jgi:hypothetical protein
LRVCLRNWLATYLLQHQRMLPKEQLHKGCRTLPACNSPNHRKKTETNTPTAQRDRQRERERERERGREREREREREGGRA